jgi:hypothetical protein
MNEVEITIKTNFKTTIKLKKFMRNSTLFFFAVYLSVNNFEKFSEVFIAKFQPEFSAKKSTQISPVNRPGV